MANVLAPFGFRHILEVRSMLAPSRRRIFRALRMSLSSRVSFWLA